MNRFLQSAAIREGRAVDVRGGAESTSSADFFRTISTDLGKALHDRNPDVRNRAVARLGDRRDPSGVPVLAGLLRDEDYGVRWKAAEALGKIGEPAVEALAEALRDTDPDVRWKAAVALGLSGSTAAIEPLVQALADPDPFVRTRAARALSRFGDAAITPVLTAMGSPDPVQRAGSATALGEMGGESAVHALIHAFADPDMTVREAAVSAVILLREQAIGPLIAALGNAEVQESVASALARIGEAAVLPLVHARESADPAVRAGADRALGLIEDPRALRALVKSRNPDGQCPPGGPEDA